MGSIGELAAAVRSGETSAVEAVGAALDAAEAMQPILNAFVTIDRDGALDRAAAVDEQVALGQDPGSLSGVPIGLKDLIDQVGIPTTNGSGFEPSVPEVSAPVVDRLEGAGAVIIGRTGLHEFAFGFTSENEHYGPVRNPWDVDLSPGGSSGGSGASVSAGIVPAAIGTDTGGSIRVPAALCGVVGLKVTHGRVPLVGVTPLAPSLDTVGPLARTVADAALIYEVIAGEDHRDPWSAPIRVEPVGEPRHPSSLVIGIPKQWMLAATNQVTGDAFRETVGRLVELGAAVETIDVPALSVTNAAATAVSVEVLHVHRDRWDRDPDRYGSDVAARLRKAESIGIDTTVDVLAWDAGVRHALARLFTRFDILITPTVGSTHKVIGQDDMDIDGEGVFHRLVIAQNTWPVNRAGNPALALPIASKGTPPASLQLIGPCWAEADLLEIGLGLEQAGIVGTDQPPTFV